MITYPEIASLYGSPITSPPPQIITNKISIAKIIGVISIIGVIVYGIYHINYSDKRKQTGKP
jgi:hypothetical protein